MASASKPGPRLAVDAGARANTANQARPACVTDWRIGRSKEVTEAPTTPPSKGRKPMYTLAVVALLGLGLFKVIDLLEDLVPALARFHALVTVVLGVALAVV